jgi:hypothetical protein
MSVEAAGVTDCLVQQDQLSSLVCEMIQTDSDNEVVMQCGPLEVNCFSVCFWARVVGRDGQAQQHIYVKIPKLVHYRQERSGILPLTADDRTLGEDEYRSLVYLSKHWDCEDLGVSFVRPLGFVDDYNAVVTERFFGDEFWRRLRTADVNGRDSDLVKRSLFRLGTALRRFHDQSDGSTDVEPHKVYSKIRGYAAELREQGANPYFLDSALQRVEDFGSEDTRVAACMNLKGLDIRQVFIADDEKLYLLDPGKMKNGHGAVDLARFLVTCRIVYWGSIGVLFGRTPARQFEASFLDGYGGGARAPSQVLQLYIIKELFKHWRMAWSALEMRPWSRPVKYLLGRFYINTFYSRLIDAELSRGART